MFSNSMNKGMFSEGMDGGMFTSTIEDEELVDGDSVEFGGDPDVTFNTDPDVTW